MFTIRTYGDDVTMRMADRRAGAARAWMLAEFRRGRRPEPKVACRPVRRRRFVRRATAT